MVRDAPGSGDETRNRDSRKMRSEVPDTESEQQGVQVDPRIQAEIGKHLRAIYDDVISEPVPSKFMELLEELERSTTQKR